MKVIKIDLKSIKLNPDFGHRSFIPTRKEVFFKAYRKLPDCFVENENCIIEEYTLGVPYTCSGRLIGDIDSLIAECMDKHYEGIELKITQEHIDVTSLATQDQYLYKYKIIKLTCDSCGQQFNSNELKSEDFEDASGDYYSSSDTVCPKCGAWDCCDVSFESIDHALKRKNRR